MNSFKRLSNLSFDWVARLVGATNAAEAKAKVKNPHHLADLTFGGWNGYKILRNYWDKIPKGLD